MDTYTSGTQRRGDRTIGPYDYISCGETSENAAPTSRRLNVVVLSPPLYPRGRPKWRDNYPCEGPDHPVAPQSSAHEGCRGSRLRLNRHTSRSVTNPRPSMWSSQSVRGRPTRLFLLLSQVSLFGKPFLKHSAYTAKVSTLRPTFRFGEV